MGTSSHATSESRISSDEAATLEVGAVERANLRLRTIGKGDRKRLVPLPPPVLDSLRAKTIHADRGFGDVKLFVYLESLGFDADFRERLESALRTLLAAAAEAGEVRGDIAAADLLGAVASLCMRTDEQGPERARRMVALLVDGLRFGARPVGKGRN